MDGKEEGKGKDWCRQFALRQVLIMYPLAGGINGAVAC